MIKLLSTLSLILAIALSPPAALAVVSNNAVPGDLTYPIKRRLESMIYAVASLNPTAKTWFAGARSDRRYQEITILATKGKKMKQTLQDLVEQTQITADQISQVSDPAEKEKLINQLSDSIAKYDAGLAQIAGQAKQSSTTVPQQPMPTSLALVSTPQPNIAQPSDSEQQSPTATPRSSTSPRVTATSIPQQSTQAPQVSPAAVPATPKPTPTPSVISSPTPESSSSGSGENDEIERARAELERIKREAEEKRGRGGNQNFGSNKENQGGNGRNNGSDNNDRNNENNESDRNGGNNRNDKKGSGD